MYKQSFKNDYYGNVAPPNHSLKSRGDPFGTDGTYGVLLAARKKLFREMAPRAARMRYDDLAVRRRSTSLSTILRIVDS